MYACKSSVLVAVLGIDVFLGLFWVVHLLVDFSMQCLLTFGAGLSSQKEKPLFPSSFLRVNFLLYTQILSFLLIFLLLG